MKPKTEVITTKIVKRSNIQLPHELANHPHLADAKVEVNEELITFTLPAASRDHKFADIWQYVHSKKVWVQVTFS